MLFNADAGNGKSFVFHKHGHILLENSITFDSFWYVCYGGVKLKA